jgi:hypothetical protein
MFLYDVENKGMMGYTPLLLWHFGEKGVYKILSAKCRRDCGVSYHSYLRIAAFSEKPVLLNRSGFKT